MWLKAALTLIFVSSNLCCFLSPAEAENDLSKSESLLESSVNIDGKPALKSMFDKTQRLKAYRFESVLTTNIKGKEITETGRLFFKSPNMIRFEALKAGKRSGAIVVRQPDGKIRGKMGGALGGIKVTLAPDSKLLKTSNGFSVLESDLGSLLSLAIEKMSANTRCLTGKVANISHPLIELVDKNNGLVFRMAVKEPEKLPEQWSIFLDGKLFSTAKFADLQVLPDLPDSIFALSTEAAQAVGSASDRTVKLSIPDYRRQMNAARAEMLVDGLTKDSFDLTADGKGILRAASDLLVEDTEALKTVAEPQPDGKFGWAPNGERRLVEIASRMELIFSALPHVTSSIEKMDHSDTVQARLKLWTSSIDNARVQLSQLFEQMDQDTPDTSLIERNIQELQKDISLLREIIP